MDLFVWYDAGGGILGFQLCFDKDALAERALTFTEDAGYTLDDVTADTTVCDMGSPVLVRGDEFPCRHLISLLDERGAALDRPLYEYLKEKLEGCPPSSYSEAGAHI
ncbi:MAG TPA: hypothetical protein VGB05_01785 [Pyrinomonadaceae bacterium]